MVCLKKKHEFVFENGPHYNVRIYASMESERKYGKYTWFMIWILQTPLTVAYGLAQLFIQ
jgi:hypothetical protein